MPDRSRVPVTINAFHNYITNTDRHLRATDPATSQFNWQRLGLQAADATQWQVRMVYWHDKLFRNYGDPQKRTTVLRQEMRKFMKDFRTFAMPLLAIAAASPAATTTDEAMLNFKRHRKKPTYHTVQLKESCMVLIQHLGGGALRFTCRTSHDSNRASKAVGADSIQVVYAISNTHTLEFPGMTNSEIHTRARFVWQGGVSNIGKFVAFSLRWYNTRHPQLAAPWSGVYCVVLA